MRELVDVLPWRNVPPPFTLRVVNRNLTFPLLALTLLSSIACGGKDDANGSTRGESGIDNSKPLKTLTPAEVEQLVRATMETMRDYRIEESQCVFSALLEERLLKQAGYESASCEEFTKSCLDNRDVEPNAVDDTYFANCTANVGQYEACSNATLSLLQDFYNGLTCDSNPQALQPLTLSLLKSEQCDIFQALCPSLAESPIDDSSGNSEIAKPSSSDGLVDVPRRQHSSRLVNNSYPSTRWIQR